MLNTYPRFIQIPNDVETERLKKRMQMKSRSDRQISHIEKTGHETCVTQTEYSGNIQNK